MILLLLILILIMIIMILLKELEGGTQEESDLQREGQALLVTNK